MGRTARRVMVGVMAAVFSGVAAGAARGEAGAATQPSATALRAALPAAASTDPKVRSIHVRLTTGEAMKGMALEAWYEAPDRYAARLIDSSDGTSLMAIGAGRAVVYDAVEQYLFYIPAAWAQFDLHGEGAETKIGLGFTTPPAGGGGNPKPPHVTVDLRSLFPTNDGTSDVADLGGGKYRLTQTSSKGGRITAVVDPAHPGAATGVQIVDKDGKMLLRVDALDVDVPASVAGAFAFPTREEFAGRMKVADAGQGILAVGGFMRTAMRDLYLRFGARSPEVREKVKGMFPAAMDWERARAEDEKASAVLREMLANPAAAK